VVEGPRGTAGQAFARKLSELREASGRTYGSLARRTGVGASTLHRYCSGRTLPMEFAPVERLARFCGCQGEELVALHRLWVLADAERSERQERGARAATTGAGPEEAAAEDANPGADGATAAGGTADAAAGDAPARSRPVEAERAGRAAVTAPPVPSRRSRRPAYAAALGAAVVAVAVLLGFGGFTTPRAPGGPSSPAPPVEAAPFTWVTDDHAWRNNCGHTYLVRRDPARVPAPPAAADAERWARSLGAAHGADTQVRITLQGSGRQAVVLESLHVRVTARRAPERRSAYRMDNGCGGSLTPRLFDVDLDTPRPVARPEAGNDAGEPIPAVSFPYRISAADPEVLLVSGRTVACDCDWHLELRWSSGGRTGTVRIDDEGRPFRTSALGDGPVYEYDYGSRRWVSSLPTARRP
jgi:transcriptional regulator with XRE-family HTH domain